MTFYVFTAAEQVLWTSSILYFGACLSLTSMHLTCLDSELKVTAASMSTVPFRQLQILTVRIKITVLAEEDRERHANSLRRFAQLIYGLANHENFRWLDIQLGSGSIPYYGDRYAVKTFVSACFRRLQTLENVKYPGINWRSF